MPSPIRIEPKPFFFAPRGQYLARTHINGGRYKQIALVSNGNVLAVFFIVSSFNHMSYYVVDLETIKKRFCMEAGNLKKNML